MVRWREVRELKRTGVNKEESVVKKRKCMVKWQNTEGEKVEGCAKIRGETRGDNRFRNSREEGPMTKKKRREVKK